MITGVDAAVLAVPAGQPAVLDADAGELVIGEMAAAPVAGPAAVAGTSGAPEPAVTSDGRRVTILCNVASAAETRRGLAAGAAGVGLVRTEIPFTEALAWPTLADHRAQLAPILGLLAGRPATVRLLDFSGDKIPPFLRGDGLTALLAHPAALRDQLTAILDAGRDARLGVLVPMVSSLGEVDRVRGVLAEVTARPPRLGIMVELAATAAAAESFAPAVDFFSIGTNDLAGQVLGLDRRDPTARPALAADPRVLRLVARVTGAGRRAGIGVSVCGDAAADPHVLPLLIGLGVDTLSVPAARVERVRTWVSALDSAACAALAERALAAPTVDAVWKLVPAP
jgi:phosphoenolpyruvate-protein kinase (PTS system EI component)